MTLVDIFNQALVLCGSEAVLATVDDANKEGRLCRLYYDQARRACLQRHVWKFATKRVNIEQDITETPAFGFTARHLVPEDYIRIVKFNENFEEKWTREGRYFLSYNSSTIKVRYVFDETLIEKWDPLFLDVVVAELANRICYALTQSNERKEDADMQARIAIKHAKRADAIEQSAPVMEADEFVMGRITRTT